MDFTIPVMGIAATFITFTAFRLLERQRRGIVDPNATILIWGGIFSSVLAFWFVQNRIMHLGAMDDRIVRVILMAVGMTTMMVGKAVGKRR